MNSELDDSSRRTKAGAPVVTKEFIGSRNPPPDAKFGIVVSRFHERITQNLLHGCLEALSLHQVRHIDVVWCPGAFELPLAAERMIQCNSYDAVIALGAVIRGETYHFEAISEACIGGLQTVSLRTGVPVALGVITPENLEQAQARSEPGPAHKGKEAGLAALEMAGLIQHLSQATPT